MTIQKDVKIRVWNKLTAGLDPENDLCGNIDDIKDNTSYAIDIAVFETASAILNDIEKADELNGHAVLVWLKKKWLIPVPDPEPTEIGTCNVSDMEITMPDWVYETPIGKKAAKEADKIVRSIKEHQNIRFKTSGKSKRKLG